MIIYLLVQASRDNGATASTTYIGECDTRWEAFLSIPKLIDVPLVVLGRRIDHGDYNYYIVEVNDYTKETTDYWIGTFFTRYNEGLIPRFIRDMCQCDNYGDTDTIADWRLEYELDDIEYVAKYDEDGHPIIPKEHLVDYVMMEDTKL